ncbi:MAG: carbohydrate ABC transporter permease [Clostridia bacterium]|nr:carbohydrate ABC transporter permease [Clostridia bacterium]
MRKPSPLYIISKIVILALFAVVIVFPFYWIIITSIKDTSEIFSVPITFWPQKFSLQNYRDLFSDLDFGRYITNSVLVSIVAAAAACAVSLCGGYVLARFKFKGKQAVIYFFLITQMLPSFIGLAPLYQILSKLHMIDWLPTLMILNCTWLIPYSTITIRGYLMRVPKALEESAMIDGCNRLYALLKIIFPLILPGFSATFIFCFVQAWNDLFSPVMYMNRQINYTIPVALNYMVQKNDIRWGELSAGAVIAVIPTVIMFAFTQKYVAAGMLAGAVKE